MKLIQKASIIRIFNDIIKSNPVIAFSQIELYQEFMLYYNLDKEDEIRSQRVSLERAVDSLLSLGDEFCSSMITQCRKLISNRGLLSREQALILISLEYCLTNQANIISVKQASNLLCDRQILFTENEFNPQINQDIKENLSYINKELRYSGFNFVYLPDIINTYTQMSDENLEKQLGLLMPTYEHNQVKLIKDNLSQITTANFCQKTLASKLNINLPSNNKPSLLFKISGNMIDNDHYVNLLRIELTDSITKHIYSFTDKFSSLQIANPIQGEKITQENFIWDGFYKFIFESNLAKDTLHSDVIIDTLHQEIIFKDINEKLSGVNRREKALYTLFLLECDRGGIDFNPSENISDFKSKSLKIKTIQSKYNSIYKIFGGEISKAPDLSIAEIRLPMISRIKKSINKISYKLKAHEDYIIRRQNNGVYNIMLDSNIIMCKDTKNVKPVNIRFSEAFKSY